jgi:hypothetical protein
MISREISWSVTTAIDSGLNNDAWKTKGTSRAGNERMRSYDPNNPIHAVFVMLALFMGMGALGYIALVLKDSRGRFRITTILAVMTAVALIIAVVRILLLIPT